MLSLYLLALLVGYHGGVLWLALRFRGRPWRWYWFVLVLVLGWGWAWWDRLFIYQVVQKDWCQRPEVGFHELAPVHITGKEVTWLTPARWPNGNIKGITLTPETQKLVEEKKFLINGKVQAVSSKRLTCASSVEHESAACIAEGYRVQTEQEKFWYWGRYVATRERNLLLRGDVVLRDSVSYRWDSSKFFANPAGWGSSGGNCGETVWNNQIQTKSISVKE